MEDITMQNEKLKEIMKRHLICSNDEAIEAINFVMELLEEEADHTQETEPYATNSINRMLEASRKVRDLEDNF